MTCTSTRRLIATVAVVAACAVLVARPLVARQTGQPETAVLAQRAADRLEALQREADALARQERTLLGDLRQLEIDRQLKAEDVRRLDRESSQVRSQMAAAVSDAAALEAREAADRPALRARLVELYKLGQGRYLRLLLSTTDLRRIGEASRTVAALAAADQQRFAAYERTMATLKQTRASLEGRQRELTALRADAARAQTAAARAAAARDALIRDIDAQRDLNAQLAGELQAAHLKLQAAVRELPADGSVVEPPMLPVRPFRGDLPWPAEGAVRLRFGSPAAGRPGTSNGVEIAAADGSTARAIHEGVVAFAGPFAGFGTLVIVDHGNQAFSLYGNLSAAAVSKGAHVSRGQAVGEVGASAAGPAGLYFELRIDGRPVDPLQWLQKK